MRKFITIPMLVLLSACQSNSNDQSSANPKDKTDKEKIIVNGGLFGSKAHITVMKFYLQHNQTNIDVTYEFGNHNVAEFNFDLYPTRKIPEFKVTTKDHFLRIFGFNKEIWKIKSENQLLIASLNVYLNKSGMTDLTKKVAFLPIITGKNINGKFNCNTKFHLGFEDKEESFKQNIAFQKILIDKLKDKHCS